MVSRLELIWLEFLGKSSSIGWMKRMTEKRISEAQMSSDSIDQQQTHFLCMKHHWNVRWQNNSSLIHRFHRCIRWCATRLSVSSTENENWSKPPSNSYSKKMYEGTIASIIGMKANFDVLVGCRQGVPELPSDIQISLWLCTEVRCLCNRPLQRRTFCFSYHVLLQRRTVSLKFHLQHVHMYAEFMNERNFI